MAPEGFLARLPAGASQAFRLARNDIYKKNLVSYLIAGTKEIRDGELSPTSYPQSPYFATTYVNYQLSTIN